MEISFQEVIEIMMCYYSIVITVKLELKLKKNTYMHFLKLSHK